VSAVEQYCVEQSDALIFPSRFAATFCAKSYPKMAPFRVIYNGISNTFFEETGSSRNPRKIGSVMRLTGIKNPQMLGKIADELYQLNYRVELVTCLPKPYSKPKYLDHVHVVAQMPAVDGVAGFYGSCGAIVCPSKFEASGNVPMESLASGTPAIVTKQMGVAELFDQLDLSHLVVSVDDVDTTVERVLAARPISPSVRKHLRREFTWSKVCKDIIDSL
jgi:glycosyltransferase involved in cell wall biosynthesis